MAPDINELYDLQNDPYKMNNLIRYTTNRRIGVELKNELFKWLKEIGGIEIPLKQPGNHRIHHRYRGSY